MKYIISLLLGLVVGAALFVLGLLYNPFADSQELSPLSVTDSRILSFGYSAASGNNLLRTNDGLSRRAPYPEDVLQLWERPIRDTELLVAALRDARNQVAGLGIKVSSLSESTDLLRSEALVDSVWYIYLPGRGSLFVEQTENYWDYVRDIVVPAYRTNARNWRGTWLGNMTAGPGALHTSKVTGGSGAFAGTETIGVETLSIKAWTAADGPVSGDGRLLIELPGPGATR